ncbi:MAG: cytochrome c oxidase subunit II [Gaiellaceae bacterium]
MRRKLPSVVLALLVALATAGVAAASNGGFTPVEPASPGASHTLTAYYVILAFTSAIFLLVEGLLVVFVIKYRRRGRPREVEGAQVHGHARLELIWTVIPVVILAVIGLVVFLELPDIRSAPAAANPIRITIEGHQYYWQFDYPNGARSIGTLHAPVDRVVDLTVVSPDVIHSWWIPALGGKIQAIPGRRNHIWFEAQKTGSFEGQCAELCGVLHASMTSTVLTQPEAEYRRFVDVTTRATLGKQEWTGVCATCHGMTGRGGYGPDISGSPLLLSRASLTGILREGVDTSRSGTMPPVGKGWTNAQIRAVGDYARRHIYKPAAAGATSGG